MSPMWIVLGVVAVLGLVFLAKMRHLGRVLSLEHFHAIHGGIEQALGAASAQPGSAPDPKNGTSFVTAQKLAFAVSVSDENGTRLLHISFSRPDGILSMSVASRIAGLLVVMLSKNKAELSPQVRNDGVFHLSFRLATPTITVKPFDEVQAIVASQSPAVLFGRA